MDRLVRKKTVRTFLPCGDKIVVLRHKQDERTEGGLYRPQNARQPEFSGVVVAVGPDVPKGAINVGDRCVYGGYYQMLAPKTHDDAHIVLKFPDEVMYVYRESVEEIPESDEEYNERLAAARLVAMRQEAINGTVGE